MSCNQIEVYIRTGDGKLMIVLKEVLGPCSKTMRNLMEDVPVTSEQDPIPLPNITGSLMEKVYAYCREHHTDSASPPPPADTPDPAATTDMVYNPPPETTWDAAYVADIDMDALVKLTQAANYLDISGLMELCKRTVAQRLLGKKPDEVFRAMGATPQEITPELEARLIKENAWLGH